MVILRTRTLTPLHEKVLKMVFKEAWRLKNPTQQLAGGADYLRGIKDDMWWNGLKDLSGNKRTTGDTKHRRSGPTTSWETPLVQGIGADWRGRRDQSSKEEWKERSDEACESLGRKWDLWLRSKTKSEDKEPPKKKQKVEEVKPTQKWRQEDSHYSGCPGKILLVTDNESLSKIVNGAEVYTGDDVGTRGSLATTTELLVEAQEKGWTTRDHHRDFALWRPREWNQLADYYANYCMNTKCTWQKT